MDRITDALPRPTKCDNCSSKRVRLHRYTNLNKSKYVCRKCKASVFCHQGTSIPLGYMAPSHTRYLRAKAHVAFDPLWRTGLLTRDAAYEWLARQLSIPLHQAHIGRLTDAQLNRLVDRSTRHVKKLTAKAAKHKVRHNATHRRQHDAIRKRRRVGEWKP